MLVNDIKYLDDVMNFKRKDLYKNIFCWLYTFTNENIKGYYDLLDFKDKNVLTVTASGDHALNALLKGAKNVETFDINPLAKYFVELKCAAIKSLDYEEFLLFFNKIEDSFWSARSKYFFNEKIYNKIKDNLSGDYREFWDYFFSKYSNKQIYKSYLFTDDILILRGIIRYNLYLEKGNYYKLREILKNKRIIYNDDELLSICNYNSDFDLVILSNVPAYLSSSNNIEPLKKFRTLIEKLNKNNNIVFVLCYLYFNNLIVKNIVKDEFYDESTFKDFFSDEFEYVAIESSDSFIYPKMGLNPLNNDKDIVILSKKR